MSVDVHPPNATTPRAPATIGRIRGLSLRTKWTAAILLVGAVPLVLFGLGVLRIQRNGLWLSEQLHEVAVADHVTSVLDVELAAAEESAHRVGYVITDPGFASPESQVQMAQEALGNSNALAQVAIYLANGRLADAIHQRGSDSSRVPPAPEIRPDFEVAAGSRGRWLPVEYVAGGALLRFLAPVNREGVRRAWVLATLRPGALSERVREIALDRFRRGDGVLVLDGELRVLASGVRTGPLATGQTLAGGDLLSSVRFTRRSVGSPSAMAGEFRSGSGEAMVGYVRSLPRRGWAVVVRRPAADVFEALGVARRSLGIVGGAFTLLALGVGLFLATRTVRPIRSLSLLAGDYAARRFDSRSPVHTGDELELLGNAMSNMADSLAASEIEIERRARIETGLSRYLPAPVARAIAGGERDIHLEGERRRVTVLFADVASFTNFAESNSSERVVAFLNELFALLTEVVFRHGGTVDKFLGDCVMAFFGAPDVQEDQAARALNAADDMHRFVEASAGEWESKYGFAPKLAIGVNTGEAVVGNLGSESRMEYTVIGDVVNVAARLESLALPGQTLVTSDTAEAAGVEFTFGALGEQQIRGKKQTVKLLELIR